MAFTGSKLLVATAFMLGMLTTASQAHSPEQEQLCTGDAFRLCSSEIPNVERVTACMIQKRSQLSDGCKAVFRKEPEGSTSATPVSYKPATAKPGKPMSLTPARVK
jgi:hypothetical protein